MLKTIGEKRVRITFNPDNNSTVDKLKAQTAGLINVCEQLPKLTPATDDEDHGEQKRLIALAMTKYEEAAMFAVKAATI